MKQQSYRLIASTAAGLAILLRLSAGVMPVARAQKGTPPPCAADGTCIPNPVTWGFYATNWNRWPGSVPAEPTAAEGGEAEGQLELPEGPLAPEAAKEDMAGPERPESEQQGAPAGTPAAPTTPQAAPEDGLTPDVELPGIDSDDDLFDPFGQNAPGPGGAVEDVQQTDAYDQPLQPAPSEPTLEEVLVQQEEDAPPALPPGLFSAATTMTDAGQTVRQTSGAAPLNSQHELPLTQPTSLTVVGPRHAAASVVQQTAWTSDGGHRAVGAAASVTDQPPSGVRQAIYIEASDN